MAQTLDQLKAKYQSVLNEMQQDQVQLENVNMDGDKLFIRGIAPSEDAKNKVWNQIKKIDPNYSDLVCDISVDTSRAPKTQTASAAVSTDPNAQGSGRTYTVQPGDNLSKIAQQFYGNASDYMKIFNANHDKLDNPDHIRVGQTLIIP